MFDTHFPYRYINKQLTKIDNRDIITYNYSFKGKKKRYCVLIEQYDYQVYAVKYYLAEKKSCSKRYNLLSFQGEATRVITTVAMIIIELANDNPFASFCFVGSRLLTEEKSNTKRFKLYSRILESKVSSVNFEHKHSKKYSSYIMINRHNTDKNFLDKVVAMFKELYPFFD